MPKPGWEAIETACRAEDESCKANKLTHDLPEKVGLKRACYANTLRSFIVW